VHGADVTQDIDIVPEARGLKAIAYGFALVHGEDDREKIRLETPIFVLQSIVAYWFHIRWGLSPAALGAS
jgi:hypothetical protein